MTHPSDRSFAGLLKNDARKKFYEQHTSIAVVMLLILFLLPIAGVFVWGIAGSALAVILSVTSYYLTPYVVLKLRGER
jgi:Na+-driven multidrug efflux pump